MAFERLRCRWKAKSLLKNGDLGACLEFRHRMVGVMPMGDFKRALVPLVARENDPTVLCRAVFEDELREAAKKQLVRVGTPAVRCITESITATIEKMNAAFAFSGHSKSKNEGVAALCRALGEIKDQAAIPVLLHVYNHCLAVVAQASAVESLVMIGHNEVAENPEKYPVDYGVL